MERNQPIVFVPRELMKYNTHRIGFPAGYVVSPAYLKAETIRYLDNGEILTEYEVEYIGYEKANKQLDTLRTYYIVTGDFVKRDVKFDDFDSCKEYTDNLNKNMVKNSLNGVNVQDAIDIATSHSSTLQLIKHLEEDYLSHNLITEELEK